MANAPVDLEIEQGASFDLTVTILDSAGAVVTLPSGCTAKAQIRHVIRDGFVLHEFSTANVPADIVIGTTTISFHIAPADTADFTFSQGVWDCLVTLPSGAAHFYNLRGDVSVDFGVTR